jgi:hypothetical protein
MEKQETTKFDEKLQMLSLEDVKKAQSDCLDKPQDHLIVTVGDLLDEIYANLTNLVSERLEPMHQRIHPKPDLVGAYIEQDFDKHALEPGSITQITDRLFYPEQPQQDTEEQFKENMKKLERPVTMPLDEPDWTKYNGMQVTKPTTNYQYPEHYLADINLTLKEILKQLKTK